MVFPDDRHANPPETWSCLACGECGEFLCGECGATLPPTARFCMACGQSLAAGAFPTPDSHPNSEPAPQGERRHATVLFSDLSGYTVMNERLDPEEVVDLMDRIKKRAIAIVEHHGGIVNQFVGDEIMALFGIPVAHEDDAVRAVRAAREMHEMVRTLGGEVESRTGQPLRMHTGINSGLIVTRLGDQRAGTIGVTGDTINTAARLKSHAAEDEVLITLETRRLISDFMETETLEAVQFRGKANRVMPYRVKGEKVARTRFEAAASRGFTLFTGRTNELTVLRECLDKAIAGVGQFVTVTGEAGMGKSRLIHEFRHGVDPTRATVVEGGCHSYGMEIPYSPLIDTLRNGLRLAEIDARDLHAKAVSRILAIGRELERFLPHYLRLLSIPSDQYALPSGLHGESLRYELVEALCEITLDQCRRLPLVLVFEDWHWADTASEAALLRILRSIVHVPLMVVVCYRHEAYEPKWNEIQNRKNIVLKPFGLAETGQLLRNYLKAEELPLGLTEWIHERCGGNPLFVEEVALAMLEELTIRVQSGKVRLNRPLLSIRVPTNVHAVIRTRVDNLDRDNQAVLRVAAVIGRVFDCRLIRRVFQSGRHLPAKLEELCHRGLIMQEGGRPKTEYLFKHALTRDVVYDSLLLQERRLHHRLVAEAIEVLHAGRLAEYSEIIAHHYGQSNYDIDKTKSIYYFEQSGDKASQQFSLAEARAHYHNAIRLLETNSSGLGDAARLVDLAIKWAKASQYAPSRELVETLANAMGMAEESGDRARLAEAAYWLGRIQYILGDLREAASHFQQSLRLAGEQANRDLEGLCLTAMGRCCVYTADYLRGVEYLERGMAIMEAIPNLEEVSYSSHFLGLHFGMLGEFPKSFAHAERGLRLARELRNPTRQAMAQNQLAFLQALHGDFALAVETLRGAREVTQRTGDVFSLATECLVEGWALFMLGHVEEGIRQMREGVERIAATGSRMVLTQFLAFLAESCALSGQPGPALDYAGRALAIAKSGQRHGESVAHRALAIAAARQEPADWTVVEQQMERSIRLATERRERPYLAITCLRYAQLLEAAPNSIRAERYRGQASDLFEEMGMTGWRAHLAASA